MVPSVRPVAAAMSRTARPAATMAASRLSAGEGLRYELGVDPGPALRVDDQYERGHLLRAEVPLPLRHGSDVHNQPRPGAGAPDRHRAG